MSCDCHVNTLSGTRTTLLAVESIYIIIPVVVVVVFLQLLTVMRKLLQK